MTTGIEAPIVAVTVYPGQARITRRARAELGAGPQRVSIGGLPLGLRPDSVRVTGHGDATVRGVDVAVERHPRPPEPVLGDLEQRRCAARAQLDAFDDAESVLVARADLLDRLAKRSGGAFARALAAGEAEPAQVATLGDALGDQLAAVLAGRRELAEQRLEAQKTYDQFGRDHDARLHQHAPDRTQVTVDLDVAAPGAEAEFDVSYVVNDARWESRYDVRVDAGTLTLTWFGLVTQDTGEDWPECDLRLSTARPASAVVVPELDPWFLDSVRPRPTAERSIDAVAAAPMAASAAKAAPGGAMPVRVEHAAAEHGVAATIYRPGRPVAVPSDGTAHRTTITVAELPARLDHVTVPIRGAEAYLRATVTNTSEHTLRPGPASIFHGNEFVGTTRLEPWAPGEEVELTLGIDDRVRVERELVRRSAGKAVLGGTRRREAEYRIEVGNYGPAPARVAVVDQVPVSRHESIVVRDVQLTPKPEEQSDLGEVTWLLELEPAATATITIAYRVDVARGVEVDGWRD